jgi:hypothetical protein
VDELRDAWREQLAEMLTEPLSCSAFAAFMGISRRTATFMLDGMPVVRVGALVRVPVRLMPPSYFLAHGLIEPRATI